MHLDRSLSDYCLLFYIWQSFYNGNRDNLTILGLSFVLFKDRSLPMGNLLLGNLAGEWPTGAQKRLTEIRKEGGNCHSLTKKG